MLKVCHPKDSHKKLQASPYKGSRDVLALRLGLLSGAIRANGVSTWYEVLSHQELCPPHLTLGSHGLNVPS